MTRVFLLRFKKFSLLSFSLWGIVILAITAVGLLVLSFLFSQIWQREPIPEEVISPVQEKINQQLEELDELRRQSGQQAATEEEIKKQLEELDALREAIHK